MCAPVRTVHGAVQSQESAHVPRVGLGRDVARRVRSATGARTATTYVHVRMAARATRSPADVCVRLGGLDCTVKTVGHMFHQRF